MTPAWLRERIGALRPSCDTSMERCEASSAPADAVSVDALLRLQLDARRQGRSLQVRNATPALRELIALCGLADVLGE
ncbi:MAG TPA: STAS domain-containing protein [Candidatus Dormibacteraeota bacterium]|nr:STAS domain-containing protein [Candidatus Dormibacteraeota bacterium]